MIKLQTVVISGFPGIGKTEAFKKGAKLGMNVLDSDSSKFSWLQAGIRNPDFPANYLNHIKENIGSADYIFISSHKPVREALNMENKLSYFLVFPNKELKNEYIDRYIKRGSPEEFIDLMKNNWNSFIDEMVHDKCPNKIILSKGQYLADILSTSVDFIKKFSC